MAAPLLALAGVSAGYGHVGILDDVTLEVRPGQVVLLLGANGAGKTTLLKTVSGLLAPTAGSILYDGRAIGGASPRAIVQARILHVAEGRALFRSLTVADNLRLGHFGISLKGEEKRGRYERVFDLFPVLRDRLGDPAGALSGGQQQMLAIAQAMMQDPRLLMLDEPSLGLAPIVVDQVLDAILALRRAGATILLVEQMVERALEIADYAYALRSGRLIGQGTPAEIGAGDTIRRAYLGAADPVPA